jgi:hypothetical protein
LRRWIKSWLKQRAGKASRCSGRSAVRPTDGEGEWATLSFLA